MISGFAYSYVGLYKESTSSLQTAIDIIRDIRSNEATKFEFLKKWVANCKTAMKAVALASANKENAQKIMQAEAKAFLLRFQGEKINKEERRNTTHVVRSEEALISLHSQMKACDSVREAEVTLAPVFFLTACSSLISLSLPVYRGETYP